MNLITKEIKEFEALSKEDKKCVVGLGLLIFMAMAIFIGATVVCGTNAVVC